MKKYQKILLWVAIVAIASPFLRITTTNGDRYSLISTYNVNDIGSNYSFLSIGYNRAIKGEVFSILSIGYNRAKRRVFEVLGVSASSAGKDTKCEDGFVQLIGISFYSRNEGDFGQFFGISFYSDSNRNLGIVDLQFYARTKEINGTGIGYFKIKK